MDVGCSRSFLWRNKLVGYAPLKLAMLPRVSDRLSFLYLERCVVNRDMNALTVIDQEGTVHIPAANINCVLLGPGTNITHKAISLLSECGVATVWVGENAVRYYAHGRPLTENTKLLVKQADLVSNPKKRLRVAKAMYEMRFPGENLQNCDMRQLRGREGRRMKNLYRKLSDQTGVPWSGRSYKVNDFQNTSAINQALSTANYCLYGVVLAVVSALGCSPGLGFIHAGNQKSFIFDIADLYKAETSIPIAFQVVAEQPEDIPTSVRKAMREILFDKKLVPKMVKDIYGILEIPDEDQDYEDVEILSLWDYREGIVSGGMNYGVDEE